MLNLARRARRHPLGVLHPAFGLLRLVRDSLLQRLPADAHLRASGRLCVSLTRLADGTNLLVSHFDSREELVQVGNIRRGPAPAPAPTSPLCPAGSALQLLLPRLQRLHPSFLPRRGEDAPSFLQIRRTGRSGTSRWRCRAVN